MNAEQAVHGRLTTFAGLTALVGTRVCPLLLPEAATLPTLTYQRVSGPWTHGQAGAVLLSRPRIQVDVWAASYASAKSVATQVRLALDGYRGTSEGSHWGATLANDLDLYEPETRRYRVILDFTLVCDESA